MVEGRPVFWTILSPAGDQKRARRHQGVKLVHMVAFSDQCRVGAGARMALLGNAGLALAIRGLVELVTQVPFLQ